LKGAIYERWLAILQKFNFEIQYKPAEQMIVPGSLSRCQPNAKSDPAVESPDETDSCFPYVPEHIGEITLPNGITLQELVKSTDNNAEVNHVLVSHNNDIVAHQESDYDGDTETHHMSRKRKVTKRKTKTQLKSNISQCEIKDLPSTVSTDESQIKEVESIDLFRNFDFSSEKFKTLQRNDKVLHHLINYLETNELPSSQKLARRILIESNNYIFIDVLLLHSRVKKS